MNINIGILALLFFVSCKSKYDNENPQSLTPEEQLGQKIKVTRNYVGGVLQTNKFDYSAGVPFAVFYWDKYIGLVDQEKQALIKLDKKGNIINIYGKRGGGPNENQRIKDAYAGNEWYGIVDNSKDIFKYVSLMADTTILSHGFHDHIDRGVFLEDSLLAITNAENNDLIINIVDSGNRIKKRISLKDTLHYQDKYIDLVYEGEFTRLNGNNVFCYFAYRHSFFMLIDREGQINHIGHTIDNIAPPKPSATTIGEFTVHGVEPDVMVNLQADIDDEYLYILSNVIEKENTGKHRAIDVYEVATGSYMFSIKVPLLKDGQTPIGFDVAGGGLVVLYENFGIAEYDMLNLN